MGEKKCSRCADYKRLAEFTRSAKSADGHGYYCTPCRKAYADENRERRRQRERGRPRNRDLTAWRADNAEHISEYKRAYRAVNRERLAAYDAEYRDSTPGWREKSRVYAREWRKRNPGLARMKDDRRRALKANAFVEDVDIAIVYEASAGICYVCGDHIDPALKFPDLHSLTLEHVHPLSRGGSHSYANCSVSHYRCNSSKGASI